MVTGGGLAGSATNFLIADLANGHLAEVFVFFKATNLILFGFLLFLPCAVYLIFKLKGYRQSMSDQDLKAKTLNTELKVLESDVVKLVAENEFLIAEMHHRVKNNLQVLSSLISSQLSYMKDQASRDVLLHSKHRLFALSLVHQKLFQNGTESTIEMSCCIKEVIDYLVDEFGYAGKVETSLDLISMIVDADTAMPFALIINELVTNSLRYAFPDGRLGKISVQLLAVGEDRFRLVYADNGIGLPEGYDFLSARSLGKTMIIGLSKQIRGDVSVRPTDGFEIEIEFKVRKEIKNDLEHC